MAVDASLFSTPKASKARSQPVWKEWLTAHALPLWSNAGFDVARGLYHERLDWDGCPVQMSELRLMVQARQISTYCRAALDGYYDASVQALRCLDTIEQQYRGRDGDIGWIFSLAPDGRPAGRQRDLYAHAFILFAYGWAIQLTGEEKYRKIAYQTATEVEQIFSAPDAGYIDTVPPADSLRRQNPHMHLLEAYLVLFEVTGDEYYLDKLHNLIALARNHLIDNRSGMLLEFFISSWKPENAASHNRVEPGHLFEWAWLFSEYERLVSPPDKDKSGLSEVAESFFQSACRHGIDLKSGVVFDAMTEDGVLFEKTVRIWPQTEFLRLLCKRRELGMADDICVDSLGERFLKRFTPAHLNGGWIDRFDEAGTPLVDYMPASSLYHIYGAARQLSVSKGKYERIERT
ncbi:MULTISPECIES: AGE family epimerase/isomerase [Gluconobacter]|uniref:AGE family epimerase/isomerase n=1 Tax=Gluconobacter TaxID=441 RepID=UPI000A3B2DA2|nr:MULTISPECIES: AGE family epimerase/isomerase [Gluconobacter]MBS1038884.1 AGE family epimerase/isomerase [Gluconobacter cerinus]